MNRQDFFVRGALGVGALAIGAAPPRTDKVLRSSYCAMNMFRGTITVQ